MAKEIATKLLKFTPGQTIITESSESMYLYVVKSGQVKVLKEGIGGKEIPIAVINSGQYLGELALLSGTNHTASAVALTDVEVIQMPRSGLEEQLKSAPTWLLALTRNLADRLIRTNEVLRRNNIVDETLMGAFQAAEEHAKGR